MRIGLEIQGSVCPSLKRDTRKEDTQSYIFEVLYDLSFEVSSTIDMIEPTRDTYLISGATSSAFLALQSRDSIPPPTFLTSKNILWPLRNRDQTVKEV